VKAVTAAQLSMAAEGVYSVTLDEAIEAMRVTAADMSVKYKETSLSVRTCFFPVPSLSIPNYVQQGLAVCIRCTSMEMELVLKIFADKRQDTSHGARLVGFCSFSVFTRPISTILNQLKSISACVSFCVGFSRIKPWTLA
jgi:hypothetical protein